MWMKQEWHLCKLHNEVFKAAESRINTECLPFVRRDESDAGAIVYDTGVSALRKKG